MAINILFVDDHKMLREGIKQLLEFDAGIRVVSQASMGEECKYLLCENTYDMVLLDINLPDTSGIDLLSYIKSNYPKLLVVMLTVHNEVDYVIECLDAGADGYVLKDSSSNELIKAIKSVYDGTRYIEPDLISKLNSRLRQRDDDLLKTKQITKREKEILIFIAEGKSNKEISDVLGISESTVKNHISNMFIKIGVADRTQAAVFAIRNNIVRL